MYGRWMEREKQMWKEISVRVIVWVVCEVVLYAQLDSGWGEWLAATSCAKLLLSCTDFTQLSVFIYAWSGRGGWVVCKTEYFSLQGLFFSQYSLLLNEDLETAEMLSPSLHSLCSFHFRIVRNDISRLICIKFWTEGLLCSFCIFNATTQPQEQSYSEQ